MRAFRSSLVLSEIRCRLSARFLLIVAIVTVGSPGMNTASAATPKRVLIVHSFARAAPPFTTYSTAFEKELTDKLGKTVDLDEVSLDVARYATLDMEQALVELMRARQAKWQPDLVVPIGSPAGNFVARHRDRLFPLATPIIYAGIDKRRLPASAFEQNATFVGQSYHIPGWVEDILDIAPETKNIAVVIGASPLEQIWTEMLRSEFRQFENRVNFIWLNDLSLDEILRRTSSLPPHSFIFLLLMMRDASGVTHNGDEVLQKIHAVANAPINGIYRQQLGFGIVGGRLEDTQAAAVDAAGVAVRILQGEPASSFPPKVSRSLPPQYDWRELQRWNIDEKSLPPNSTVLFRTPTFWQQHRTLIIGVASVGVAQALLIFALVANLVRRRLVERSLGKSEERVTLAAEAARLGVWEMNTLTGEIWASDKAREIFEFDADLPLNRAAVSARVHPEDRAAREAVIDRAIEEQAQYEIEYRVLLKDGSIRWVSGRGRCTADESGKPPRLIGVSMDVTERKEAQELVRVATEASPSGTLLVNDRGHIVLVNAHVEELFGYERQELIGKPIEILLPERFATEDGVDRTDFLSALQSRIMGVTDGQLFACRKDGSEFSVEVGLNPVEMPRGRLVLVTVVDISPRKRAEEEARRQREQNELLGRASLLGEMTASLAHELNQPLAAIMSNASAGTRFVDRGNAESGTLREIFSDIGTDGRRARDIIENVRNAIKKGGSMRGRIGINNVVKNVALMMRPDAAAFSCEVQTSLAENLPLIEADPVQMQQVLINLVSNSFHAMRETPTPRRKVEITTQGNGNESVRITVRDYGTGISDETRERLFEQFYTTKKDGLGMGLAIVRSIVEAHGGKITAGNAKGGGACFEFELPATAPEPRERP
jgi:PAS domain S-box-containing protein